MYRCFDFHEINGDNETHTLYSVCNKSVDIQFSAQDALLEYKKEGGGRISEIIPCNPPLTTTNTNPCPLIVVRILFLRHRELDMS